LDDREDVARKLALFQELKERLIVTLKEPLEKFAANAQTLALVFSNPQNLNSLVFKVLTLLAQEVGVSEV